MPPTPSLPASIPIPRNSSATGTPVRSNARERTTLATTRAANVVKRTAVARGSCIAGSGTREAQISLHTLPASRFPLLALHDQRHRPLQVDRFLFAAKVQDAPEPVLCARLPAV